MTATLLRNATIVTIDADDTIVDGDLLIRDGRIAAIGEVDPRDADGAYVVDVSGHVLIPGFVQTHIHLCQTLMRNCADDMALMEWLSTRIWPYEAALEPEDAAMSARIALAELALGGTTAILDMGTVHHTEHIIAEAAGFGIRAHMGKCMMNFGDDVPAGLMETREDSLKESLELCDTWHGAADGRIQYAFAPRFAVSCTEGLLRDVVEAAADRGVFIHTHASETTFENDFAMEHYGCRNMEFLERIGLTGERTVLAHGVHVSDSECEMLARTKTAISHCPSSNLKLASGIANMPRYDEYGVKVSLGADGAPCNNNLDAFIEMRLAALLQKPLHGPTAMPAKRVLQLATIDGARALGLDDVCGSLEVGKSADIVAMSLQDDPGAGPGGSIYSRIVYSAHRANVRHVWASGNQLVRRGELVGWDLGAMMAGGREALARVWKRMP
jgi:5-methylthioadenosine/S-adenosylhomocysteine deaminase